LTWNPSYRATDARALLGNLVTFFEANQVDALLWAHPAAALTPLTIYPTVEFAMLADFPHMGVVRRRVGVDDSDELPRVTLSLTWEMEVAAEHTKDGRTAALLQLMQDVDDYTLAVESMALNIPRATLLQDVSGVRLGARAVTNSDPMEKAISDTRSVFNVQLNMVFVFLETPYG
jgi:hypothetical protein